MKALHGRFVHRLVRRAIEGKVPFGWVTADAGYGYAKSRRPELERADAFHVLAATRHDTVVTRWAVAPGP